MKISDLPTAPDLTVLGLRTANRETLAQQVALLQQERLLLRRRIEQAHEALTIDEFDGDSCPDLESTVEYAIGRYRAVCQSESEAADRIQELRIQADVARELIGTVRTIAETWRTDPGAFPDGAADALEQIATVLLGPPSTRKA